MGRGSSGKGSGGAASSGGQEWRNEMNSALRDAEQARQRASEMAESVNAARAAYNAAPTRSKAQRQRADELETEYNRLARQRDMLLYTAAQAATRAENLRMENDPRYRNRRNRVLSR